MMELWQTGPQSSGSSLAGENACHSIVVQFELYTLV